MRGIVLALLLTTPAASGCLFEPALEDCRSGRQDFLLFARGNKDFYNSAEEVRKDRFETLDHDGLFFDYIGDTRTGTGKVLGADAAFRNVSREQVLAQLKQTGQWLSDRDHVVESAWRASTPQSSFDALCQVLIEEAKPPSTAGETRVGCADGGTRDIKVSLRDADWERTIGCLADQSQDEADSSDRIGEAIAHARAAARERLT